MSKGKFSKVYKKIAKSLFEEYEKYGKCDTYAYDFRPAICPNFQCDDTGKIARKAFQTAFKPYNKYVGDRWYDSYSTPVEYMQDKADYHNKVRDHRVFSLLIMHELAKDYERLLQTTETENLIQLGDTKSVTTLSDDEDNTDDWGI